MAPGVGEGHSCTAAGASGISSLQACADAAELLQLSDSVPGPVFSAFYLPGCSCISSSGDACDLHREREEGPLSMHAMHPG